MDRNLDAIYETFRRLQLQYDDHEVKASADDAGHGPLEDKTKAGGGTSLAVVKDGKVEKLQITSTGDHMVALDAADNAADGAGYLLRKTLQGPGMLLESVVDGGVRKQKYTARGDHKVSTSDADEAAGMADRLKFKAVGDEVTVHADVQTDPVRGEQVVFSAKAVAPSTAGSYLYPAVVLEKTVAKVTARFIYYAQTGCGGEVFFNWTEGPAGTWTSPTPGPYFFSGAYTDFVTPAVGDVFIPFNANDGPTEFWKRQIYIVLDPGTEPGPGTEGTPAIVRRVDQYTTGADYVANLHVEITEGTSHAGQWLHLLTAQPITLDVTQLEWELLESYTASADYELDTFAQLIADGADSAIHETTFVATAGRTTPLPLTFVTPAGSPGIAKLPAGPQVVQVEAASCDVTDGTCSLQAGIYQCDAGGTVQNTILLTTSNPALLSASACKYQWADPLATDYALAGTDRMALKLFVVNTGSVDATVTIRWSSSLRLTWLRTTATFAVSGTLDHQLLTATSRGFAGTVANADPVNYRHPKRASQSIALPPLSIVDGNLTPDPMADTIWLNSEVTIQRIDSSQFPGGCGELRLMFNQGGHLIQAAGSQGDFDDLDFGNFGGIPAGKVAQLDFGERGNCKLFLYGDAWQLDGAPNMGAT